MDVRRVDIGRLTLAVAEAGAGGRPLLLVHGFTGAKEEFTDVAAHLAGRGWHAVAPDLRGHGASDWPTDRDGYAPEALVADVVNLVDALGWETFTLVGHSMGGALAQRIALDHPHRLSALVLMSTFHGPIDLDPALVQLGVAVVEQGGMEALAAALAAQRAQDPAAQAARDRMEQARPGYGQWADSKLQSCSPDMWLGLAPRFLAWPDTLDQVGALRIPTLVVVGADDERMRSQSEELAKAIPGAQLHVLDDVRHSPHLEAPDRCLSALVAFLDDTVGS